MRSILLLTILWLQLVLGVYCQQAQVFFFPPPPSRPGNGPPTLSGDQANAVIQHHLGSTLENEKVPEDHGLWGHFMGLWEGSKRPKVVIVDGVDTQLVFPSTLSQQPTFYLEEEDTSILDPYFKAAQEAIDKILNLPFVKKILDTLDLAIEDASQALAKELTAFIALADSLWVSASQQCDAAVLRLSSVAEGSVLWDAAVKGTKAGIESMTQPDSGPVVLVIMPGAGGRHYRRQQSTEAPEAPKDKNPGKGAEATKDTTKDYSSAFAIIAGTVLLFFLAALGSIALLFSVGNESLPPSLNLVPAK